MAKGGASVSWERVDPDEALPKGPKGETVGARIKRLAAELHDVCTHQGATLTQDEPCGCPCSRCRRPEDDLRRDMEG
jgi:hypothetical protein